VKELIWEMLIRAIALVMGLLGVLTDQLNMIVFAVFVLLMTDGLYGPMYKRMTMKKD
jgi:hypothetical protein